jgi:hypothetical protein
MSGTDSLLKLVAVFDAYIQQWCARHETLDLLAEAKAEASVVWEEDERENARQSKS